MTLPRAEPLATLSVAIIARNEERHIGGALASVVDLAGEIVAVIDNRSCDATADICHTFGARVHIEPWRGFPAQRNRALDLCTGAWVLFLDADEQVTPDLAAEIRAALTGESGMAGFWIPRHNLFFGRQLQGGGWYPDYQLRLMRRNCARYDEARTVHEFPALDGPSGRMQGHLLHHNIEHLNELWRKQRAYAIQEAHTLLLAGASVRWRTFVGAPAREFYRRFVTLHGYRDGALGLFLCATMAYFEVVKYVHLKGLTMLRHSLQLQR
ncbi:MAG: glycosyltransferase family 2 protein [Roseiflexus sp.]|jgi:glycosyltransferase involved in cell wall biosynthesis|nr:glycosyltransferase family 2 protein [Roseiflexus sp.]